ncbi:type II toxin-antitoxin system HicB family antitoxin [Spirochaeta dissipatitropha]
MDIENQYVMHLTINQVENGQFMAESPDVPGLVAQGRTISDTVEITQDLARKIIGSYIEHGNPLPKKSKSLPLSGWALGITA